MTVLYEGVPRPGRVRYAAELVAHLVRREFRLRYRRAILGWTWSIAEPLARLGVMTFIFTKVFPLNIPDYPTYLFAGLIAMTWFSSGLTSATTSAVDRSDLLFRPGLPRTIVPIVSVLTDGIDYVAALPVLTLFLVLGHGVPPTAVLLPLVMAIQFLLTVGIGFALCAANVYLRDVRLFLGVGLMVTFYLTPVFYSPDSIPARYQWVIQVNPMAHLIADYRAILVQGEVPSLGGLATLAAVCAAAFVAGYAIYQRSSRSFVDEL